MLLKDVLKGIDHRLESGNPDIDIKGIFDDSRAVVRGGLFFGVRGYAKDGAAFVNDAIVKGASAVVLESELAIPDGVAKIIVSNVRKAMAISAVNFYREPSSRLKTIGITGTNGKTTVTYLLESIVKHSGADAGVIGTINYRIAGKTIPAKNTTPGSLEIQSLLSKMADGGSKYAIMEVSSHALHQGRVFGLGFNVGVFTNITSDHLDYHKTRSEYFKAKAMLFDHLKKGGTAVLNYDDKEVMSLADSMSHNVMTYGMDKGAGVAASDIRTSLDGSSFSIVSPSGSFGVKSRLVGMHNISNCLSAAAVALALGIDKSAIARGIESIKFIPGRLEPVDKGQSFKVFVDYAHTEDALNNVLSILKKGLKGKILTVFGCGGNRDRSKRPLMGISVCKSSDVAIITSDNPRFEEPLDIIRDIESGLRGSFSNYEIVPDRREAIRKAIFAARDGDIVLVAGKGHEDYQIIKDKVMHFDDREEAAAFISQKMEGTHESKGDGKGSEGASLIGGSR